MSLACTAICSNSRFSRNSGGLPALPAFAFATLATAGDVPAPGAVAGGTLATGALAAGDLTTGALATPALATGALAAGAAGDLATGALATGAAGALATGAFATAALAGALATGALATGVAAGLGSGEASAAAAAAAREAARFRRLTSTKRVGLSTSLPRMAKASSTTSASFCSADRSALTAGSPSTMPCPLSSCILEETARGSSPALA
mmetsp:Transcript_11418/g.25619  ORF Transcript_11418/g.25619 Transcript_11418/m.25619 type:complete len:208 (-) Transcript_11418:917-1540(-)